MELLENTIDPMITEIVEKNDNLLEDQIIFSTTAGAPPHYAVQVREFLNERCPARWIGRRGAIEWPARSPNLNLLDFISGVI